ncbi:hypothetical protein Nepgr_003535 [Nepenthes gracilis]|uniref:Uncharacterized protein n=1 Tax=Nepenthes gracilis TaxID=150966 RepID=A0AAD3XE23_NEPGR|nr:hypothetical protein Nepgr_003535 [Nepenthes gracilis]
MTAKKRSVKAPFAILECVFALKLIWHQNLLQVCHCNVPVHMTAEYCVRPLSVCMENASVLLLLLHGNLIALWLHLFIYNVLIIVHVKANVQELTVDPKNVLLGSANVEGLL